MEDKSFDIPYFKPDLKRNLHILTGKIKNILREGILVNGQYTHKLEEELERRFKGKKALIVDSGTSALVLALRILSCENKYVLIPSFVCSALLHAVLQVGAKPLLYDIEYPHIYFDVKKIKKMIPKNFGAIIVVHLFGIAANIEEFVYEFGKEKVIEDCATSFGTKRKNKLCGTFSNIAILSFGPTKYIHSIKGGALLLNGNESVEKALDLYYYDKKDSLQKRYNFLSNEISNLVSYYQIKNFNEFYTRYRTIYNCYKRKLSKIFNYLETDEKENNFYKFILLTYKKDFLKSILHKSRIEAKEPVFSPLHRMLKLEKRKFCGSEEFYKTSLSLPLYSSLRLSQINKIIRILNYTF